MNIQKTRRPLPKGKQIGFRPKSSSKALAALSVAPVEGEILREATLDARTMCSMNFAREEFDKLARILWPLLDPMLCNGSNTTASDIARHIEQIRVHSGNFCHRHRHLGASHGVVGEGGAQ